MKTRLYLLAFVAISFVALDGCNNPVSTGNDLSVADTTVPEDMTGADDGAVDSGKAAYAQACTMDSDCESEHCIVYDKKPTKLCSYLCEPGSPNPKCPDGCNQKGFCRIP